MRALARPVHDPRFLPHAPVPSALGVQPLARDPEHGPREGMRAPQEGQRQKLGGAHGPHGVAHERLEGRCPPLSPGFSRPSGPILAQLRGQEVSTLPDPLIASPWDPQDPRRDRDPREPDDQPRRDEPLDDPDNSPLEQPPVDDPSEAPEDEPVRRDPDSREPPMQV